MSHVTNWPKTDWTGVCGASPRMEAACESTSLIATLVEFVGAIPVGIFLVDRHGTLYTLNRAAKAVLESREVLEIAGGRLNFLRSSKLSAAESITAAATGRANGPACLSLTHRSSGIPVPIMIVAAGASSGGERLAAVLVSDPSIPRNPELTTVQKAFGLTAAEGRLAGSLMQGRTLHEAADELGITVQTARAYLKKIFQKTGTRRQCELIYLLLSTPFALNLF